MRNTAKIALAAFLMMAGACHKVDKDAQLKALDEAYKSGVFTKEEYDAKRQAIVGPPAAAPVPAAAPAPAPVAGVPAAPDAAALPEPATTPEPAPTPAPAPPPVAPPPKQQATPRPVPQAIPVAPPPQQQAAPPVAPPPVEAPPVEQPTPAAADIPQAADSEPAPLAGCQDAETRAGGPNGAQQRFFPAPEDVVREATLKAFANLEFTIHRKDPHEIEASKKGKLNTVVGAGAERVIVHFARDLQDGRSGTKVTAETKKGLVGRVTQKPWTGAVMAQITCNLRGR